MVGEFARKLDEMTVRAKSPDGRVLGELRGGRQIEVGFADEEAYWEYGDEAELADQLTAVLSGLMSGRRQGREALVREATGREPGDGRHWNARRRRFRDERDLILARGVSHDRWAQVESVGLLDWKVSIAQGALEQLDGDSLCAEVQVAFAEMWEDHAEELYLLKQEVYGEAEVGAPREAA